MDGLRVADAFRTDDDPDVADGEPDANADLLLILSTPNFFFALRNL